MARRTAAFGRLLVTGGAGFIGSCYVRDVLARRDGTRITVLDKLTYAGNEANLAPVRDDPEMAGRLTLRPRATSPIRTVVGPLVDDVDAVVNFAAESHVDRSILDPEAFLATGVIGVHVLLEACRAARRPAALPPGLDRRGLRLGRRGPRHRGRPARAALPVRGGQGGRRAARPELRHHPRRSTPS